jgi:hypothetical protein
MTFKTGTKGKVVVGSTTLNVQGWNFEPGAEFDDTTHTGGEGYASQQLTVLVGSGSFNAVWDTDASPVDDPPNLMPGEEVELKLYIGDTALYWHIPTAQITSLPVTSEVRAGVKFTCNFQADGEYGPPGSPVT